MGQVLLKDLLEKQHEMQLKFKNLTSDSPEVKEVKLLSIGDSACSISLPVHSCSKGHQLRLCFSIKEPHTTHKSKIVNIEIIGKMGELTAIDAQTVEGIILFNQFVKEEWNYLVEYFEKRQDSIDRLVKKLKLN